MSKYKPIPGFLFQTDGFCGKAQATCREIGHGLWVPHGTPYLYYKIPVCSHFLHFTESAHLLLITNIRFLITFPSPLTSPLCIFVKSSVHGY